MRARAESATLHPRYDLTLQRLGELLPSTGEHLDAVVLERIVRRGNHQAGVEPHLASDISDRRRRNHAGGGDRGAGRASTSRQLLLNPHAGFPGISADDETQRAQGLRATAGLHGPGQRRAEAGNGRVIERVLSRLPAHAVCTEEVSSHEIGRALAGSPATGCPVI